MSLKLQKIATAATLTFVLTGGLAGCSSGTASTDGEGTVETEAAEVEAAEADETEADESGQYLEQSEDVCMGNVDLRD